MVILRKQIVKTKLERYGVVDDIENIFDRLSFRRADSQILSIPNWEFFTRKLDETKEFAAVYRDKNFLIKGNYSKIDNPQRDLETINNVFQEGLILRTIRSRSTMPLIAGMLAVAGIGYYNLKNPNSNIFKEFENYCHNVSPDNPAAAALILAMFSTMGAMATYVMGISIAGNLLERHYASKLSEEAESYLYGKDAEYNLVMEDLHQKVRSGELSQEEFSKFNFERYFETSSL